MKALRECFLYGIVDLGYVAARDVTDVARRMVAGGVDLLQLRAKSLGEGEVEELARLLVPITDAANVALIINDHPQLVPSVGAQGAHVGQDDFSVSDARWRAGRASPPGETPPLIGKSTHSLPQAHAAQDEGADYIGFGPLFPTATKPGRPAIGLHDIARVHAEINIPIFCIGGITADNLDAVLEAGALRVVIVSAILQARDIETFCAEIKSRLSKTGTAPVQIGGCG